MQKRRTLKVPNVSSYYLLQYPLNFSLFVDQEDDQISSLSVFRIIIRNPFFDLFLLFLFDLFSARYRYGQSTWSTLLGAIYVLHFSCCLFHDGPVDGI